MVVMNENKQEKLLLRVTDGMSISDANTIALLLLAESFLLTLLFEKLCMVHCEKSMNLVSTESWRLAS